jgi:hypothetical protein
MKGVLGAIFHSAASHFSLTVYESTGVVRGRQIHSSHVKRISRATSDGATTQFSLTVY